MGKFKRRFKSFLLIVAFLFINVVIDAAAGAGTVILIVKLKGDLADIKDTVYGLLAAQIVKFVILYIYINIKNRKSAEPFIKDEKIKNPLLISGIGVGVAGFGLLFTNCIVAAFKDSEVVMDAIDSLEKVLAADTIWGQAVVLFVTIIGAPIVEELLFRGFLFEKLTKYVSTKSCIILTAIVFAYYHFNIVQTANTFFIGLVLAYVYYKTRSIKASILVHMTNNAIAMVPIFDQGLSAIGIAIYLIFLITGIYSLRTLRQAGKEYLTGRTA